MKKKKRTNGISAVARALKRYKSFLITAHINPEGDSIGSQLAMATLLRRLGKKYVIIDSDPVPKSLEFLLFRDHIRTRLPKQYRFDALIALDCPDIVRLGNVAVYAKRARALINIDHHISNTGFGDVRWVDPATSSCGEMLFYLFRKMGLKIDKRSALYMYVAIVTDTGSFVYENTNHTTHQVVSDLLKTGVQPLWVENRLNETKTVKDLALLMETLKTLQLHYGGRVVTLHTSAKMLEKVGLGAESTENFVNYGRSVKSAKIAVFLLERPHRPGEVHISFRSKGDVNVSNVASLFGGGGHRNAAGCLIKGSIKKARATILPKLKKFL